MLSTERTPRASMFRPISPFRRSISPKMDSNTANSNGVSNNSVSPDAFEHIFIVTGPAGSGKSTVAQYLADKLNWPYVEGDDYHTAANKEKMSNGIPLTDADRWDWLIILRNEAIKLLRTHNTVIVTCSALKHKYRDVIRVANYEHPTVQIHFVYLKVDQKTLLDRVASRVGHYMKEGMVKSQLAALEEPDLDDETDVIAVDVTNDKETVQTTALTKVQDKIAEYKALEQESRE